MLGTLGFDGSLFFYLHLAKAAKDPSCALINSTKNQTINKHVAVIKHITSWKPLICREASTIEEDTYFMYVLFESHTEMNAIIELFVVPEVFGFGELTILLNGGLE